MSKYILLVLLFSSFKFILLGQKTSEINIIRKPIVYNAERIKLSLDYLKDRHHLIQTVPSITPRMIVLHYTAGGTLASNFNYFNKIRIENAREFNKNQSPLNVSAHYIIDRDGMIYNLVDDTLFARHTIGLNYCAIGIENVGSNKEPLTNAQVKSNAKLIRHLKGLYGIEYVIGHSEYGKFRKSALWKETNPKYYTDKDDPGADFMIKVRALIKDLNLKSAP